MCCEYSPLTSKTPSCPQIGLKACSCKCVIRFVLRESSFKAAIPVNRSSGTLVKSLLLKEKRVGYDSEKLYYLIQMEKQQIKELSIHYCNQSTGNPLECDSTTEWMFRAKTDAYILGRCEGPRGREGMDLKDFIQNRGQ
ncbi:hypothetical protein HNY73_001084 [Argiope bruennichi]|uniref:Uncharacterized protein n=1 Tax=Argiope bruennichi TaxID=94029 RepID=A0A8T0G0H2_ARGBR|nr:hypothetical protein HNY73_001084 [Argiope bruennichi]